MVLLAGWQALISGAGAAELEHRAMARIRGADGISVAANACPALDTFAATGTFASATPAIPGIPAWAVYSASQARATFEFDAAGSRAVQSLVRIYGSGHEKRAVTRYLGSYEIEEHDSRPSATGTFARDKTLHRHRLGSALYTSETLGTTGPTTVRLAVVLTDHIGSTDVIVRGTWQASGWTVNGLDSAALNQAAAERQSCDAWGDRRNVANWSELRPTDGANRQTTAMDHDRGFTGHEMLDDFGLIHMNGRIYDPEIGRFLSPDPYVQVPEYSQNFNRYTYVLNNPLSYTDPSGHFVHGLHVAGFLEARDATRDYLAENPDVAQLVTIVVGVVLTVLTGGAAAAGWTSFAGMGLGGFSSAVVTGAGTGAFGASASGGDVGDVLRGAAVGAVSAAVTAGVLGPLDHGTGWAAGIDSATRAGLHIAGHGMVGGLSNAAMGGKFQDGFLSGLAGAVASHAGVYDMLGTKMDLPHVLGRTAIAGVVGGTASAIGGGKFANGAYTAAFQHLLNYEAGLMSRAFDVEATFDLDGGKLTANVFGADSVERFEVDARSGGSFLPTGFVSDGSAIPKGDYYIVPDKVPHGSRPSAGRWFMLFKVDAYIDDYTRHPTIEWPRDKAVEMGIGHKIGLGRGDFRLHLGEVSTGCVTIDHTVPLTDKNYINYIKLGESIHNTRLVRVPLIKGGFPTLPVHGILTVQ